MKRALILLIAIGLMMTGCATIKLSEKDTTIVMAKEVDKVKGAKDITDAFTYEGNIYVYITFRWDDFERSAGQYTVKAKWYNGDKLVSIGQHELYLPKAPWYVWIPTRGTSLGVGKCRVEVYANDIYVGSKSFAVAEK